MIDVVGAGLRRSSRGLTGVERLEMAREDAGAEAIDYDEVDVYDARGMVQRGAVEHFHVIKEGRVTRNISICAVVLVSLLCVSETQAQGLFDKLLDRAGDSAKRKAENRVNQRVDQSIDKAINKTEDTVKCVATDQECLNRAKNDGKQIEVVDVSDAPDTMKCVATDMDCLKQAKHLRKKVEIVDEADVSADTLRCKVTDAQCLQRAKAEGKKVEITD
jgi:hypothetical protein